MRDSAFMLLATSLLLNAGCCGASKGGPPSSGGGVDGDLFANDDDSSDDGDDDDDDVDDGLMSFTVDNGPLAAQYEYNTVVWCGLYSDDYYVSGYNDELFEEGLVFTLQQPLAAQQHVNAGFSVSWTIRGGSGSKPADTRCFMDTGPEKWSKNTGTFECRGLHFEPDGDAGYDLDIVAGSFRCPSE